MEKFWQTALENAEIWRMTAALVLGIVVGWAYFSILRLSIQKLSESKHKVRMFAGWALLRILMFFGGLVLIANRNVVVILIYLVSFFITKTVVIGRVRHDLLTEKTEEKAHD